LARRAQPARQTREAADLSARQNGALRETRRAGFIKVAEKPHADWGVAVVGETWERE
jgi:hypothetical protein